MDPALPLNTSKGQHLPHPWTLHCPLYTSSWQHLPHPWQTPPPASQTVNIQVNDEVWVFMSLSKRCI